MKINCFSEKDCLKITQFVRVPTKVYKDEKYRVLSNDAKIFYAFILERLSLSIQNHWTDDAGKVYVIYSQKEAMYDLNCSKVKVGNLFKELEKCNLINIKRRGQGMPSLIFVAKDPFIEDNEKESSAISEEISSEYGESFEIDHNSDGCYKFPEAKKMNFKNHRKYTSRGNENVLQEVNDMNPNKNNGSNINNKYINQSNFSTAEKEQHSIDMIDKKSKVEIYRAYFYDSLSVEAYIDDYPFEKKSVEEVLDLCVTVMMKTSLMIRIGKEDLPADLVKSQFMKLKRCHIEYVFRCINENSNKITNFAQYMITALYNATISITNHVSADVSYNMRQAIY